ncbi:stage II sporulation protein M [Candidatus Woesearchaeota archaeon]|nr:stage II sporulation protein M [Candidatus Woesearchaeota archaeon]
MVLEALIDPTKAERKQWVMFFIGFLYSSVALGLGYWVFQSNAGLVMVFLTVLAVVPLMYNTIKLEEMKDLNISDERTLLREHGKALSFFMFLFFGIVISCMVWYIVLPSGVVSSLFSIQSSTIAEVNGKITGDVVLELGLFWKIFSNNLWVLMFCIVFAFLYGFGAIFILTWNASVIGVALGNFVRSGLAEIATKEGVTTLANYFQIISLGILRYAVHGIPEVLAYFVGGLAGGIISVAVIKHDFGSNRFGTIVTDSLDLFIIALGLLFVAALLEVFVTPALL